MPASELYQSLIVNPTKNVNTLHSQGGVGKVISQQVRLLPERRLLDANLRQFNQQFQLDAAMWYGAVMTGPYSFLLLKIFHIFYHAGVMYRTEGGWEDWSTNHFGNVASLLSHGQRVLVQIPSCKTGGSALWAWLNKPDEIPRRPYATHGQSRLSPPVELMRGHRQQITEKHGWGQAVSGHLMHRHHAFNVALGGEGNRNPFSAANDDTKPTYVPIRADGLNGHVYINYMEPTDTLVGGMLIGCENAEHGRGENPHTKAGHGLGGAQKVSACGGKKWSTLKCGPQHEYNGIICDLTDRGKSLNWLLSHPLFDPNLLDSPTGTIMPVGIKAPAPGSLEAVLKDRRRDMGYEDAA